MNCSTLVVLYVLVMPVLLTSYCTEAERDAKIKDRERGRGRGERERRKEK